jgi:hypothetical protein
VKLRTANKILRKHRKRQCKYSTETLRRANKQRADEYWVNWLSKEIGLPEQYDGELCVQLTEKGRQKCKA